MTGAFSGWILALVPAAIFVFLLSLLPEIAAGETLRLAIGLVPAYGL